MVDRDDRWGGGAGDPVTPGPHATVFHGASFCLSDPNGDVRPRRAQGYFQDDTRLLSTWQLLVDERFTMRHRVLGYERVYRDAVAGGP